MVARLFIVAQLLGYQLLTMPCQACPMATAGAGECSASDCCSSEGESELRGGGCGSHEETTIKSSCCGEDDIAPSSCCDEEPASACCGESVSPPSCGDDASEKAVTALEPVMLPDGCKCCPISMPCDRCVALNANRPPSVRTHVEMSTATAVAFVTVDSRNIYAVAACLHPPDANHKASIQSLQCSWLN